MSFVEACQKYDACEIDEGEYAEAWLEETNSCYKKLGGLIPHGIYFVKPCHWHFEIFDSTTNGEKGEPFGRGVSRGSITFPVLSLHPETAAKALIAYEKITVIFVAAQSDQS